MLEYLQSKYSEEFVVEPLDEDQFVPPQMRATVIFHPSGAPQELFGVTERDGEFRDERVLAAWDRVLEGRVRSRMLELFGEGTLVRVQGGAPDSWTLGASDIGRDPNVLFTDKARPSSLKLLVAVPVREGFSVDAFAPSVREAWDTVTRLNSGDGWPQLVVYLFHAGEDPTRFLDLRAIPGAAIDWASMNGVIGRIAVNPDVSLDTDADVRAAYYDGRPSLR